MLRLVPQRICPRLAFSADRRHAADVVDADHVCTAQRPAQWLERSRQADLCLTDAHIDCPRFVEYQARLAAHRHDDPAAPSFPFVSSRLIVHPDPAWRGLAGRAAQPVGRRIAAGVAGGAVLAVAAVAVAGAAWPGAPEAVIESASPSALPSPTSTPEPTPTPVPSRSATQQPTASPARSAAPTQTPPPPTLPPTPVPQRTYVVQESDTLGSIAQQFGVSVEAIQAANRIADPDEITVGQVLVIP